MDVNNEIKHIIKSLRSKKKFKEIDGEKLFSLFSNSVLDFTGSELDEDSVLTEIKDSIKSSDVAGISVFDIMKRLRWIAFPSVAIFVVAFFLLTKEFMPPVLDKAKVYFVRGDVELLRGNKRSKLKYGDDIFSGDKIITGKNSISDFSFNDKVKFRLSQYSEASISRMKRDDSKIDFTINMGRGSVLLNISKLMAVDSVKVKTSATVAVVRGTVFGVKVNNNRSVKFEVFEGKIKVAHRIPDEKSDFNKSVKVKLNEYFEKNSRVINKNEVYSLRNLDSKMLNGLSRYNIDRRLPGLSKPGVKVVRPKEFEMSSALGKFLEIMVKKDPNIAKDKIKLIEMIKANDARKREESFFKKWRKSRRSKYVLHVNKPRLLISVSSQDLIEASDFKRIKWTFKEKIRVTSKPVFDDRRLYFIGDNHKLYALNLYNGKILWEKIMFGTMRGNIRLVIDGDSIYAATSGKMLYRLSKDGKQNWSIAFKDKFEVTPIIGKYMIFLSLKGGKFYGVDRKKGIKVIKVDFKSPIGSMSILNNNIYMTTTSGKLLCYSYKKDEIMWSYNLKDRISTDIIADNKYLYIFTTNGKIYKFSSSGKMVWNTDISNEISINTMKDNRYLYIASERTFYIIDKDFGRVKWSIVLPRVIAKNIATSKNKVFLVSDKKGILIFRK
ncbi:PQQ-binding-like beta-propeller repeat protein [Spirochaetota bacterium]